MTSDSYCDFLTTPTGRVRNVLRGFWWVSIYPMHMLAVPFTAISISVIAAQLQSHGVSGAIIIVVLVLWASVFLVGFVQWYQRVPSATARIFYALAAIGLVVFLDVAGGRDMFSLLGPTAVTSGPVILYTIFNLVRTPRSWRGVIGRQPPLSYYLSGDGSYRDPEVGETRSRPTTTPNTDPTATPNFDTTNMPNHED